MLITLKQLSEQSGATMRQLRVLLENEVITACGRHKFKNVNGQIYYAHGYDDNYVAPIRAWLDLKKAFGISPTAGVLKEIIYHWEAEWIALDGGILLTWSKGYYD